MIKGQGAPVKMQRSSTKMLGSPNQGIRRPISLWLNINNLSCAFKGQGAPDKKVR